MNLSIIPTVKSVETDGKEYVFADYSPAMSLMAHCRAEDVLSDFAIELKGKNLIKAELDTSFASEEYFLDIKDDGILIKGGSDGAVHYGFCSLVQLSALNDGKIPGGVIHDLPDMPFRAVSDDISRGQISTVDGFKAIIRKVSYFKYNTYMPYIEDTFRFAFCPDFGKYSDPVPASEWKEICEYASGFGVSVRPIINLLGHWDKNSKLYDFADLMLKRNGKPTSTLDVTKKEVKSFICEMLDEIVAAFGKGLVHVGGDEASDIKEIFGMEKGAEVFVNHFNWLSSELKKRGCTMMMYADMFVPVWGDYSLNYDAIFGVDRDTQFLFWDYAPRDEYSGAEKLKNSGLRYGVSPASWSWNRFIPQFEVSFMNSKNLVKQVKGDCKCYVLSSWNDGGCGLREEMTPGIAAGGQFAWHYDESVAFDSFFKTYHKIYFGYDSAVSDAFRKLYDYDKVFKVSDIHEYAAMGAVLFDEFWKDARKPTSEKYDLAEKCSELLSVLGEAEDVIKENKPLRFKATYDAFLFDVRRLMWALMRVCVIPSAAFESREEARSIVDDLTALSEEFELIKKENRRLWMRGNRQSEWNYLESRYIDTEQSLYSLIRYCKFGKHLRVEKYL